MAPKKRSAPSRSTSSRLRHPPSTRRAGAPKSAYKDGRYREKLKTGYYEKELRRLQVELVKLQEWVIHKKLRVVVLFEGRDAAGKGGVIKRITQHLNPRSCHVVALAKPTERERTQWYFQRYAAHLPAAGEIVLFDRSWYNRAVVEPVMGFCTAEEYEEFLQDVPGFELQLVRSGILLVKYWFSITDDEQNRRFKARIEDRVKRWKLSPVDVASRSRWVEFSKARDRMLAETHIPEAPWHEVDGNDKKRARLNCIRHLLSLIPYKEVKTPAIKLPRRQRIAGYKRPARLKHIFVPEYY